MKRFLPNLLIFFSLALCGLCAFQWAREAHLRTELLRWHDDLDKKASEIRNLEALLKTTKAEITRLDALKTELTETLKTNRLELAKFKREAAGSAAETERHLKQIEAYKQALEVANENIRKQNDDIRRQNDEVKKLAAERNDAVLKYNSVVEQYNDLVKQFTKYQADVAKALGNKAPEAPPPSQKSAKGQAK
jgi:chromosome segregation ATPase